MQLTSKITSWMCQIWYYDSPQAGYIP